MSVQQKAKKLIDIIEDTHEDENIDENQLRIMDTFERIDMDVGICDERPNRNLLDKYEGITKKKASICQNLFYNVTIEESGTLNLQISPSKSVTNLLATNIFKPFLSQLNGTQDLTSKTTNHIQVDKPEQKLKHSSTHANLMTKNMKMKSFQYLSKCNASLKNAFTQYCNQQKDPKNNTAIVTLIPQETKQVNLQSSLDSHLNSFFQDQESIGPLRIPKSKMHSRVGSVTSFSRDFSKDKLRPPLYLSPDKMSQNVLRHSVQSQHDLSQRLLVHKEKMKNKIAILQEEQEEIIMKECSFTPHFVSNNSKTFTKKTYSTVQNSPQNQLATANNSMTRRNPKQFFDDQIQYQEKTMKKLINIFQDKCQEEQKKHEVVTLVCKGSEKIMQQKRSCSQSSETVYDRLYQQPKEEKSETQKMRSLSPDHTFHPQILSANGLIDRNQKVEDILYQDAMRRQHKRQQSLEALNETSGVAQSVVLPKSEQLLSQPFEREFRAQAQQIFTEMQDIENQRIDLKECENLMVNMGFIVNNCDRIEMMKLWDYINPKGVSTINLDRLLNVLLNIQNIKGKGDFKECRKIHYKFSKFFKNRENFLNEQKKRKLEEQQNQDQVRREYHTLQNPISRQINNKNEDFTLGKRHDLLLQKGQEYLKRKQQMTVIIQEEQIKDCTFKPTFVAKAKPAVTSALKRGILSETQFSMANQKNSWKKIPNAQSIQALQEAFSRQRQESKKSFSKKKGESLNESNKENQLNSRNVEQTQKDIRGKQETGKRETRTPLVFLDIHINKNKADRITIYNGQDPEEVIQRFAMKNYLTNTDIQLIRKALMQQVTPDKMRLNGTTNIGLYSPIKPENINIAESKDLSIMRYEQPRPRPQPIITGKGGKDSEPKQSQPSNQRSPKKKGKGNPAMANLLATPIQKKRSLGKQAIKAGFNKKTDEKLDEMKDQKDYVVSMKDKLLKSQEKMPKFMMHHNNKFRIYWDVYVMLLAVYNSIEIPFTVAFEPDINIAYTVWERCVDITFGVDIIINFRTSYINTKTGFEITNNKSVILNYIKSGRFFVDLSATIPWEILLAAIDPTASSKQLRLFGLFKLIRLLRLNRIIRYMKVRQDFKLGMRLIQLLFGLFLLIHWVACIWFITIKNDFWVPPRDEALYSPPYDITQLNLFYSDFILDKYFLTFYYAILLMMGNDIMPLSTVQTIVGSIIIILGALVSAFILGNMAAIMASINKKANQFDEQMDLVNSTMRQMKLDEKIQDQVLNFMVHMQNSPDLHQDLEKFFLIVNEPIRKQVLYYLHQKLLKNVTIMSKCSTVEQSFFICRLKPVLFLPDDYVFSEGEQGDNLYFINKGEAQVMISVEKKREEGDEIITYKEEEVYRIMKEGSFFGEVALLTKLKRSATVKTTDYSNCAYMDKLDMITMEAYFPHIVHQFRMKIKDYSDPKMHFRRQMIKNLHYMRDLGDEIINEIICCLQTKRYGPNQDIIKCGDVSNVSIMILNQTQSIHFLREGAVNVVVSAEIGTNISAENERVFDTLNKGSAFCAYTFISDEAQQLQTFRVDKDCKEECLIESISREDIYNLAKKYYQLADQLDMIREKFDENETDFDFFRFRTPRKEYSEKLKSLIRKKFRVALCRFYQRYRDGQIQLPEALQIIKKVQAQRAEKVENINKMRAQLLGVNYGPGYGDKNKFSFTQLTKSQINNDRSEVMIMNQSSVVKTQSQLLTQSVLLAQENLKKQNQLLLELIDQFDEKYTIIKETLSNLQNEADDKNVDEQLLELRSQAMASESHIDSFKGDRDD